MGSIVADCVGLLFIFLDKRNVVGEFAKIFETVIGVEIATDSKKVRAL